VKTPTSTHTHTHTHTHTQIFNLSAVEIRLAIEYRDKTMTEKEWKNGKEMTNDSERQWRATIPWTDEAECRADLLSAGAAAAVAAVVCSSVLVALHEGTIGYSVPHFHISGMDRTRQACPCSAWRDMAGKMADKNQVDRAASGIPPKIPAADTRAAHAPDRTETRLDDVADAAPVAPVVVAVLPELADAGPLHELAVVVSWP